MENYESFFDNSIISDNICDYIQQTYINKLQRVNIPKLRCQMVFNEKNKSSWLYSYVNEFVIDNMGSNYSLIERVAVLRYEKGDYFEKHTDGEWNTRLNKELPYHFYGGVEISNKNDFEGGEFILKNNKIDFKKGRLFTHGFDTEHGVSEVTKGIRWSIHFPIYSKEFNKNLTYLI